ncbi:MAG: phosphate ABC transporter permease PstA, partial [Candidatus Geothermarchaeales archaeon]
MNKGSKETLFFQVLRLGTYVTVSIVVALLGYLVFMGSSTVSFDFLASSPREGMTAGGVYPAVVGTLYLMSLVLLVSLPLGVAAAVYLSEYAGERDSGLIRILRVATANLAGVPSIVYGLLGLGLFVLFLGFGFSLLSASLTLSLLTLPVIITASEEALKSVPPSYREAAFALGATRWQTTRGVVVPHALPGILTASIIGLSRAAGETAPIMVTGVAYFLSGLPRSVFDQFMALPFHIFALSTQSPNPDLTRPIQFGAVLVLLLLVLSMNLVAI